MKAINGFIIATFILLGLLFAQDEEIDEIPTITPEIVELEEMVVVGMQTLCSRKVNLISVLWQRFTPREKEITNIAKENVGLGVSYAMVTDEESEEMTFFHLAGLIVNSATDIPEGMTYKNIPAHKYAKFTHKGLISELGETYGRIYNEWLPNSEYEYDGAACEFEWYDERFIMGDENSEIDIFVPIKKK